MKISHRRDLAMMETIQNVATETVSPAGLNKQSLLF